MTTFETIPQASETGTRVLNFALGTRDQDIPEPVLETTAFYLLDCIGVLAAAGQLQAGRIARTHAVAHWAAGPASPAAMIAFDGRTASLPGAAFAMATQLDNLDAHDGWQLSKGHAGAALVPALLSVAQACTIISGREALAHLTVGYEVSNRAAAALHGTVNDYHTSGAWNAIGCAAIAARCLDLSFNVARQALGIAEYHAPRSQMMREIANPSMLHDGSGFGAPVGLYAALIARDGFLGAPAATLEFADASAAWDRLGKDWTVDAQYIKPYPICRWAHAPIDAAIGLRHVHDLKPTDIDTVEIESFAYAADLSCEIPKTSHEAQYTLAWPVACALVRGRVGVQEILPEAFVDPLLRDMTARVIARATDEFEATYPNQRRARVIVTLKDGKRLMSPATTASGGPDPQPTRDEIVKKFRAYAGSILPPDRVRAIENAVLGLTKDGASFHDLLQLLLPPVEEGT